MMTRDFALVLGEIGKTYTLRTPTISEGPIWGEGTASYADRTVTGFLDHYDLGREMLGMGDLGIGMTRIFLQTIATPNVNDLLVDESNTYKINKVDTYRFSDSDVYVVCDLSLEQG